MLEKLKERGYEIKILNCLIGDDEKGLTFFHELESSGKLKDPRVNHGKYLSFFFDGIEYFIVRTKSTVLDAINAEEQSNLFSVYVQLLERFQPDMVLGYSGDLFSTVLRREAQSRGIPVVYALCNGLHGDYAFKDCDLVFTTSKATSDLYRERDGVDVKFVGNFFDKSKIIARKEDRKPEYVTLINPAPHKGIAVFAKIVQEYNRRHGQDAQKFLVVKSLGDYEKIIGSLHYPDPQKVKDAEGKEVTGFYRLYSTECPNPLPNMMVAEHTSNIAAVYAVTKVLICPSLWHESWGRVATEANMNGIPVLGTTGNGLYEAIGGGKGGILLDAPASSLNDHFALPTDEEIKPWVDALEKLLAEDYSEGCAESARINDIERSVDRLVGILEPLLEKGSSNKHPFSNSSYFTDLCLKRRKEYYDTIDSGKVAANEDGVKAEASPSRA